MRKIKFRGKRKDIGWKYGYLTIIENAGSSIFSHNKIAIKPVDEKYITYGIDEESIGQFTGFKDKNGKEIYEGDIVQEQTIMVGHTGKVFQQSSGQWSVSYRRGSHPLYTADGYENSIETHSLQDWTSELRLVIIGNIYENPEFLLENK